MGRHKRPMKSLDLPGTSTKNKRLKEEYDLAYYVHDRVELMHKVFSVLSPKELKAIAPASCSKLTVTELQEICLEELLGISSKRICAVLDGVEAPSDTDSSASDSTDDEESTVRSNRNEVLETVCLDTESDDESVVLPPKKQKKPRKKNKSTDVTVTGDSDKQKRAAERAGVTVLELLELQARARAIRAQLQAQGKKKPQSNTTQSSEETEDNLGSHHHTDDDDGVDELIEVKEEPAVIEISSDEEKVKIEEKDEPSTKNKNKEKKPEENTKSTEKMTNDSEKQPTEDKNKTPDDINTNKKPNKLTNTNKTTENTREKHKKTKNKTSKKKKSKEKQKSPLKLSPIKDSIYENNNENNEKDAETRVDNEDDVVLISDSNDFTITKAIEPENAEPSDNNVIIRKIQIDKEKVVISIPNTANNNCKIVTETTQRLNSTVSKVERKEKKINSTVCKVKDKTIEKRKKVAKKVARRESDDGINLELSDDEKLEMDYLCSDKAISDDGHSSESEKSDGIIVVLNRNETPTTNVEKNTTMVKENNDDESEINDRIDAEQEKISRVSEIEVRIKVNDKNDDSVQENTLIVTENDDKININDRISNENDRKEKEEVIKDCIAEINKNNIVPEDDIVDKNLDQNTDENCSETIKKASDKNANESYTQKTGSEANKMDDEITKNENNTDKINTNTAKTNTYVFNTDLIDAVSNKNINVTEINTINISCIEDIPLMPEGPKLPTDIEKYQTVFPVEARNDINTNTDTESHDSEPDSETDSSSNDRKSNDDRNSSPKDKDFVIIKEKCDDVSKNNDEELNVNDENENEQKELSEGELTNSSTDSRNVQDIKNVHNSRSKQQNRDKSDGEITDSSTDIEVTDLKPDIVFISGSDEDKPNSKNKKKMKRKKKNLNNKKLDLKLDKVEDIERFECKKIVSNVQSVKDTRDTKEIQDTRDTKAIKTIDLIDEAVILELSDDSSCYEVEGVNILSKEPTAEEIEALSARIDDFERIEVITNEEIQQHEAEKETNLTEEEIETLANVSWKDRYLSSKKVKVVMSTANILNALRKKNIELKKKIETAKKVESKVETAKKVESKVESQPEFEIGSIDHYNTLQGSTKYVDPVKAPEIKIKSAAIDNIEENIDKIIPSTIDGQETVLTKEMKKDAKLLLKMYKRLLKHNDINKVKTKNPEKKKKKKSKKSKLNET